jgi:hypothetical protein
MDTIVSVPICISVVKISIWRLVKLNERKQILSQKNWSDNERRLGPWTVKKEEEVVSVERIERACLLNRVDVEMEEVIRDDKVAAILGDRVVVAVVEILGDKVVVVAVAILEDKVAVAVAAAVFVNVKRAGGTNKKRHIVAKVALCL